MSEWPWKGAWNDDIGFDYEANDCVDNDGISYRCLYDHSVSPLLEPGAGKSWEQVWQRLGQTKPEHKNDDVYEAWRKSLGDGMTFFYQKGEYVRHQGHKYVCRIGHSSHKEAEPGVGDWWVNFWDLVEEVSIPAEEVSFPPVDVSSKLFFAPNPVLAGGELEEVSIERLKELVEKGECQIHFELKKPCKPIFIADMELIEIEETEDGTYVHMLVLRDLT